MPRKPGRTPRGEARHRAWHVRWMSGTPLERIDFDTELTEGEARKQIRAGFRGYGPGGRPLPTMELYPADVASSPDRCHQCGVLLRLHRRGMIQFETCYR